jgi:hypothetical protein
MDRLRKGVLENAKRAREIIVEEAGVKEEVASDE